MMLFKHKYPTLILLLLLFSVPHLFAQCPAPNIVVDPVPICNLPVTLKADGGSYINFKWSTNELTPQITVGANGTYTVTVTCADNTTASATLNLNFAPPTVQMASSLVRPCLPDLDVRLQLQILNGIAGNVTFKLRTSNGDTITLDQSILQGNSIVQFILPTVGITSFSIISAVSSSGCNFAIGVPKTLNIVPVFQSEADYPTIGGDPFFCANGETQLNVIWTDPEPTLYRWVTPGFPQWPFPFYNVVEEGTYTVLVTYTPQCEVALQQFVEEIQPMPDIVGSPICSGGSTTITTSEPYVAYEWSTGETSPEIQIDQSGEYRVTVTDAYGCTNFAVQNINEVQSPNVSINGPIVLCTGQNSAQLVATAFNASNYAWSTGASTANILITGPGEYTVTITSNNGCTGESTQVVEQINTPTVALTSPIYICQGASVTLTPVTSTPDVAYAWSNGATTSTITVSAGGVYRVSVSDPTLSCTTSALTLVTVLPPPVPVIGVSASTVCAGGTIVLTTNLGAGNTYLWSNGSTASSITTTATGTFTVTVTSTNGCKGTDTESVTVLPVPSPQISGPQSLCGKDSVFLSTTPFPSINWSTGDTSTGIWIKSAGNYNVVVTNALGCTGSKSINVANTVAGALVVNGSVTLCGSDSITLVATGPFLSFAWSNGINNDSVVINTPGIYNVTGTDTLGCTATKSSNVTNQGGFSTTVAFAPLCNSTVSLNAENGFAGYLWSSGATTQTYQANAAGAYTVTVTNAAGCTSSANYNVTVLPDAPVPTVAGPGAICPENSGDLSVAGTYQAYAWSTGSSVATAVAATPGIYTVTVTDQYNCTGTGTVTIGAFSSPTPVIAGSQTICNGQPSELSVSSTYTAFAWSNGDTDAVIDITDAGTYTVTVTNTNGCTSATAITVTASDILSPNVAVEPYNCDDQLTINAGAGYTTYLWSTGATTSTINITAAGEYAITVTNSAGCTGTSAQIVESIPVTPGLGIQGVAVFCDNATTVLSATPNFNTYQWSTGANGSDLEIGAAGTYTVTATDVNGCTRTAAFDAATNQAPVPAIFEDGYNCNGELTLNAGVFASYSWNGGTADATLIIEQTGTYTVTVTDGNGCTGIDNIDVLQIPSRPQVELAGPNRICTGSTGTLTATAGFVSYAWSTTATTESIDVDAAGTYTVTATDVNNCTATAEQSVDLLELPTAVIVEEPYNCDGQITLSTTDLPLYTYEWSTGSTTATAAVTTSGTYALTLSDPDGCSATASFTTTVPVAPNPQIVETPLANYTVQLEATAGFVSYEWSNGALTAATEIDLSGTYTVTVTDALGCTATASEEVELLIEPLVVTSTVDEITCANGNDGSVELCINGGQGPYSVTSTPNATFLTSTSGSCTSVITFTGIPAGTFNWTALDANNVSFSGSYIFTNPDPLSGSAAVAGSTITASAAGGVPPYQYSLDGNTFQESPVFANLPNGAYQVVIRDERGCTNLTGSVIVFTVDTDNPAGDLKLQITPNPGDGNFWLTLENYPSDEINLSIWDVTGRNIRQMTIQTGGTGVSRHPIDLNNMSEGTYLIQVRTNNATQTVPVVLIR